MHSVDKEPTIDVSAFGEVVGIWQKEIDTAWAQVDRLEAALASQREKAREFEKRLNTYTSHGELLMLVRDFLRSTFGI